MNKYRKYTKIALIMIIVLFVISIFSTRGVILSRMNLPKSFTGIFVPGGHDNLTYHFFINFDDSRQEFDILKDRIIEVSEEHNNQDVKLRTGFIIGDKEDSNNQDVKWTRLGEYEINEAYIEATKQEVQYIQKVDEFFDQETLNRIFLSGNRILFGLDGNHYSIVYSNDGKRPRYMVREDESWKFLCYNLGDNWYLCRIK